MHNRQEHQHEIHNFLQKHLSVHEAIFSLPPGTGMETYFVRANERRYFIKVGAPVERYVILAESGLTPPVIALGQLESGSSIMVQYWISGRSPSQRDFQDRLEEVAEIVHRMHHHPRIADIWPPASSRLHRDAGMQALARLREKWKRYKVQVPDVAGFVDESLDVLTERVNQFSTEGLVASHNDICNANWLFASDGKIYLVDFESMSLDDPAMDLGALLWWYYPPDVREQFLKIAGYRYDPEFRFRMQVRMSMHCLNITLPRDGSFDDFAAEHYSSMLTDFKASLMGKENPKGYGRDDPESEPELLG